MPPPLLTTCSAVAVGGAVGGLLRWSTLDQWPAGSGFPTTLVLLNVLGSGLLALLPTLAAVRRRPVLAAALGPGLLGGFTTLSTASEETRVLLAEGRLLPAAAYVALTLLGALAAVRVVRDLADRTPPPAQGGSR